MHKLMSIAVALALLAGPALASVPKDATEANRMAVFDKIDHAQQVAMTEEERQRWCAFLAGRNGPGFWYRILGCGA